MIKTNSLGKNWLRLILILPAVLLIVGNAQGQTSQFTYQGRLTDAGNPADGLYDFQFKLFDSGDFVTGTQQGPTINLTAVQVENGVFTVELDFGAGVFTGAARFLEIGLRPAGSPDSFNVLSPRQPVTATPYAVRSATAAVADTATNAAQLGGLTAGGFIQNTTSQQSSTNFNIGGTGTANIIGAAMQFNLGGFRILKRGNGSLYAGVNAGANSTGASNSFFGDFAGFTNSTGSGNSFYGVSAGNSNATGSFNSFFGYTAGQDNTTSDNNSFFGYAAGNNNTTGSLNSFFGVFAGQSNTTSSSNSFFGYSAGTSNTTGEFNSFFGRGTGGSNTTSNENAFFGYVAGGLNTTGANNTFLGSFAGFTNTTGNNNTIVGRGANVGGNNLSFATAIGSGAVVNSSNTIVLGRSADTVQIPGTLNSTGTFGANVINATTQFNISNLRVLSVPGNSNLFTGINAGNANTTGAFNAFFGNEAGTANSTGEQNTFIGESAGLSNTTGVFNTFIGRGTGGLNTTGSDNIFIGAGATNASLGTQVNNSIVIGRNVTVSASNTIVLGTSAQTTQIPGGMIVRGSQSEGSPPALEVANSVIGGSVITSNLYIRQFNELASPSHICWRVSNAGVPALVLTTCTSSLSSIRDKTEMQQYSGGLDLINHLKPVAFKWKEGGSRDFGLNAEDVAEVEPLLVTRNARGEAEDVKHENLMVVFINAFKQQQAQIKSLQQEVETLKKRRQELDELKALLCADHPGASICKSN